MELTSPNPIPYAINHISRFRRGRLRLGPVTAAPVLVFKTYAPSDANVASMYCVAPAL